MLKKEPQEILRFDLRVNSKLAKENLKVILPILGIIYKREPQEILKLDLKANLKSEEDISMAVLPM